MATNHDILASMARDRQTARGGARSTLHRSQRSLLALAVGRNVQSWRQRYSLTVQELAVAAGLSPGMLSRIENGQTSPSLESLQKLATALQIPVAAMFMGYDNPRDASFVKAGSALKIERRGSRSGHQYHLLGHCRSTQIMVEPYLIVLDEHSDAFPVFQHEGLEFLHMLEGEMKYRHGTQVYHMFPGDSLFFDADAPHGPEELCAFPIRFLSIISYLRPNPELGKAG